MAKRKKKAKQTTTPREFAGPVLSIPPVIVCGKCSKEMYMVPFRKGELTWRCHCGEFYQRITNPMAGVLEGLSDALRARGIDIEALMQD